MKDFGLAHLHIAARVDPISTCEMTNELAMLDFGEAKMVKFGLSVAVLEILPIEGSLKE